MTEAQLKARIKELEIALAEAVEYIEGHVDVVDGPDGPEPDEVMVLCTNLKIVLGVY